MSTTPGSLVYLYGIVDAVSPAATELRRRAILGLVRPGGTLYPIEAAGLAAAVSHVPEAEFAEAPLNALVTDLAWLAPYAVRHEEAIRLLVAAGPAVVPMAFGAVYHGPAGVEQLLRERVADFSETLARLRGRQEWGLKVFVDAERAIAAAETASDDLRRLTAEAAAAGPGKAYLLNRRREQIIYAEADRLLRAAVADCLARLGGASVDSRRDEPPPPPPGEPQLVLKAAFLVETDELARFHDVAAALARDYQAAGLTFNVTGPWAPYSFVGAARVTA